MTPPPVTGLLGRPLSYSNICQHKCFHVHFMMGIHWGGMLWDTRCHGTSWHPYMYIYIGAVYVGTPGVTAHRVPKYADMHLTCTFYNGHTMGHDIYLCHTLLQEQSFPRESILFYSTGLINNSKDDPFHIVCLSHAVSVCLTQCVVMLLTQHVCQYACFMYIL